MSTACSMTSIARSSRRGSPTIPAFARWWRICGRCGPRCARGRARARRAVRTARRGRSPPGPRPAHEAAPRRWLLPAGLAAAAAVALLLWRPWTPAPALPSQAQQQTAAAAGAAVWPTRPPVPAGPVSPALTVTLQDGGRTVGLTSDGTLAGFDGFGGDLRSRLTETLRLGRLPASPRAADTVARAGELMSNDVRATPFVPVGPRATAVSSATPAFQWTALRGATAYRIRIVDDRLVTVAVSEPITTLTWRPEAPLPSRRVLSWQVEATTPDGAAHHARAAARRGALHGADADRTGPGQRGAGDGGRFRPGVGGRLRRGGALRRRGTRR